ncbi:MAG: acyl-CoA dehydrogenase family protein [Deltaproteobacteria bacterium]|nr:acyl-CoA dehydrogenase family protein [Deltaproteobacteria bacterium]
MAQTAQKQASPALAESHGGLFLLEKVGTRKIFTPEHLSDEQKQFAQLVHDFVTKEVMPKSDLIEDQKFDQASIPLMKKAGELGILAADFPEAYGGMGIDKVTGVVMGENACLQGSFGVTLMCHTGIATWPLIYFGTEAQKAKYLPKLATGEWIGAYCLTEPNSGSDALGMRTRATLSPDGKFYTLNGEKVFITNGGFAKLFTVFAKIDGDDKKVTAFLVEKSFPGVSIGKEEKKMGIKGSSTTSVIFQDAKVPVENILGEIGRGHKVAFNILNLGRFKLGVAATGGSKYLIAQSVKYAKERKQFNRPIASFGLIQKKLSDMVIHTFVSEGMNYRTASLMDEAIKKLDKKEPKYHEKVLAIVEEFAVESSIAKVYGSESLDFVVDEAVQILGGYGFLSEYFAERPYRDQRVNRIFEGTNEINRLLIPGMLIKRTMKGELDLMGEVSRILAELKTGFTKTGTGLLVDEIYQTDLAKRLAVYASAVAVQKYAEGIKEEQFVLEYMADLCTDAYCMDTAVIRALQMIEEKGESAAAIAVAIVKTYVNERYHDMIGRAKRMFAVVAGGAADEFQKYARALQRFDYYVPIDTVATRKKIAEKAIEVEKYPFD